VQKVADMVKEAWVSLLWPSRYSNRLLIIRHTQFAEAIKEEPDLFLLVGLVTVSINWCCIDDSLAEPEGTCPLRETIVRSTNFTLLCGLFN
jgi:hypothetical protein